MTIKHFNEFRTLSLAISLLVVFSACDLAPPPPQVEPKDGFLTVHLETMGEYPTTVSRIQVTEDSTGTLVWEIVGSLNSSQLWSVDLRHGANDLSSSGVPDGKYEQLVPGNEEPFFLEQGKAYRLRAWGESDKSSSVTFTLQEQGHNQSLRNE